MIYVLPAFLVSCDVWCLNEAHNYEVSDLHCGSNLYDKCEMLEKI